MWSADLYKARSTIATKFKKRNEGIIRTFKAGIHTGFWRTEGAGEKTGWRSRNEAAFANVSDAGGGIDHCYSPGFFDHADIKDKKGRDVMWRIRYALQVLKDDRGIGVVEVILILVGILTTY